MLEPIKKRHPTSKDKEAIAKWEEGYNLNKIKYLTIGWVNHNLERNYTR